MESVEKTMSRPMGRYGQCIMLTMDSAFWRPERAMTVLQQSPLLKYIRQITGFNMEHLWTTVLHRSWFFLPPYAAKLCLLHFCHSKFGKKRHKVRNLSMILPYREERKRFFNVREQTLRLDSPAIHFSLKPGISSAMNVTNTRIKSLNSSTTIQTPRNLEQQLLLS